MFDLTVAVQAVSSLALFVAALWVLCVGCARMRREAGRR